MSSVRQRRPTQIDVANEAGVSQTIVSFVVNDKQKVAIPNETRQRVLDAIERLGYVPNRAARSLRSSKTWTISVIIPDIRNPFYPEFVRGVQDVATEHNYDVLIANTDAKEDLERSALAGMRRGIVDGVILVPYWTHLDLIRRVLGDDIPVTLLSNISPSEFSADMPVDMTFIPGDLAAAEVVRHLYDRGHRRIGMIAGGGLNPPRERRIGGYRKVLEDVGLPFEEDLVQGGEFSEEGGYACMKALLALAEPPTAVFIVDDLMALGAYLACKELGVRIPEDVAIAAFDHMPLARHLDPPLTTLDQQAVDVGRHAAQLLFSRIRNRYEGPPRVEPHSFRLLLRGSS